VTRLALFDCDGTLADSAANICRAVELAFAAHDLTPPSHAAIRGIVGLSLPQAMAVLHPDAAADFHDVLAEEYKAAFRAMRDTAEFAHEPLYPGIPELIDALADAGWRLGVATGKSDRGLTLLLDQHGIRERFATLQTADRHPSKPHPAMALAAMAEAGAVPGATVVIGDTSFDMAMARAAGAHALGVSWGYHPPAQLLATGAQAVVADATEIGPAVLALTAGAPTCPA
jgi:phosphoglycolate phosphatase